MNTVSAHSASDWLPQLDSDGYAIIRGVAGPGAIEFLRSAFDHAASGGAAARRAGAVYASRKALTIPAVRAWAASGPAYDLARSALGADARPVRGILFDKRPEANWPVAWHQDVTIAVRERRDVAGFGPWSVKAGTPHVQPPAAVLEQMVTVRLHLDDASRTNGALRVIAGSHRFGKLSRERVQRATGSARDVTCEVATGDVVLMRPLLLHSSAPSEAPHHRRVVHVEYASGPLADGLEWAETPAS